MSTQVVLEVQLLDKKHKVSEEIGQYSTLPSHDFQPDILIHETRRAFEKAMKRFEVDLHNFKKGNI